MTAPSDTDQARDAFDRGKSLHQNGEPRQALEHFNRAAELAPRNLDVLNAIGNCHRDLGELESSIAAYRRALAIRSDHAPTLNNLAVTLQDQGKLDEAIASFRRALELQPVYPAAHSNMLLAMNYHEGITSEQLFAEYHSFARLYEPTPPRKPTPRAPARDGRIRIGYLSPDFRGHSLCFFIWPVLNHHDRARFAVTCYSDVAVPDALTDLLRKIPERWVNVAGIGDDQLTRLIERDQIDILIDLAGHTAGNRLPLFARRVAPIQGTYLGYPNTTGLSSIDYRITDAIVDPPGVTESQYSEKLVRLPQSFFTQLTISDMPDVAPPPAAKSRRVTFAVFSNFCKVRSNVMRLWARILREVVGARLLLQAKSLRDPATRAAVACLFADEGIAPDRLDLREYVEFPEYIGMYRDVDIVLDTFPFNGHTTTCQALWMGVPVVTLAGQTSRSRMGASVLHAIGLNELVAQSEDEYVQIASNLARDLPRLTTMRSRLREQIAGSCLLDCPGFARSLESAFCQMLDQR